MTVASASDIAKTIQNYINTELYEDGTFVEEDDDLLIDIGMDSLSLLLLVAFLEKEFELDISPALITIKNFRSVEIISQFLLTQFEQQK